MVDGDLKRWEAAVIAVAGAFCLQLLRTANETLFWIIFFILLWLAIYRLMKRYMKIFQQMKDIHMV